MSKRLEIAGLTPEEVATLLTKRNYAYYCEAVGKLLAGECAFCTLGPDNVILAENDSWAVWSVPLKFQAGHMQHHFVMKTKRHVLHVDELTEKEWADQFPIIKFVSGRFGIAGGALVTRFGDPALNAGSVQHLHTNIMVPDGTGRVHATLAKEPEEIEVQWLRMAVYEKMRTGTPFENLEPAEQELVRGRLG